MFFYQTDCTYLNQTARLDYHLPGMSIIAAYKYFSAIKNSRTGKNKKGMEIMENEEIINRIIARLDLIKASIDWDQSLLDASFVIFDSETTGLYPFRGDKIISLSGVIVEKGEVKAETAFDKLIDPLRPVPPRSTKITGITDAMVSGKPTLFQALPEFLDFIDNKILVAHYAPFDLAFLNLELGRHAPLRILNPTIDTCLLAKSVLPGMLEHSLESLLKRFGIEIKGRHTALGDALMTARLFLKLLEMLAEKNICTLNQLGQFLVRQKKRNSGQMALFP